MKFLLINAVNWFADILIFMLLARAVLSWFISGPYSGIYRVYQVMCNLTEPLVAPCRRITMKFNTGMLDLSVFLAFFMVSIGSWVITLLLKVLL